jgi:hypothetical protein
MPTTITGEVKRASQVNGQNPIKSLRIKLLCSNTPGIGYTRVVD